MEKGRPHDCDSGGRAAHRAVGREHHVDCARERETRQETEEGKSQEVSSRLRESGSSGNIPCSTRGSGRRAGECDVKWLGSPNEGRSPPPSASGASSRASMRSRMRRAPVASGDMHTAPPGRRTLSFGTGMGCRSIVPAAVPPAARLTLANPGCDRKGWTKRNEGFLFHHLLPLVRASRVSPDAQQTWQARTPAAGPTAET